MPQPLPCEFDGLNVKDLALSCYTSCTPAFMKLMNACVFNGTGAEHPAAVSD